MLKYRRVVIFFQMCSKFDATLKLPSDFSPIFNIRIFFHSNVHIYLLKAFLGESGVRIRVRIIWFLKVVGGGALLLLAHHRGRIIFDTPPKKRKKWVPYALITMM